MRLVTVTADWLDRLFLRVSPPAPCFQDGWGDLATADPALRDVSLAGLLAESARAIEPRWTRSWRRGALALSVGEFDSPAAALIGGIAPGRVWRVEPRIGSTRALCLAFAAWNDETLDFRLRLLAPLVRRGLSVWIHENPLYGARRLRGRSTGTPRSVHEFLQLGFGTVQEARGLLAGMRARCDRPVGVYGFSMGGHLALLTAALQRLDGPMVAVAPSCTPASVFLDGMLAAGSSLQALGEDAETRLRELLDRFRVTSLPPPPAASRAAIIAGRRDGIVPPSEPAAIARHWGAPLTWLETGHVGAVTLHRARVRRTLAEAFRL